jgi:exopolyphosphatase / guanosine-5'-triphosphate,3'-diphosphate pyrophosphatase
LSRDVLAVLDLGSNSAHLLVAEVLPGGHIRRVATEKTRVRLAEPVVRTGRLGSAVRRKVIDAVAGLIDLARDHATDQIAVVATDALRHAADGDDLRRGIEEKLAVRVRILDGLEEAALSFRGMASALWVEEPMLGLDLGGGSLEVAYGAEGRFVRGTSLPLGSARASTRFAHDPPWLTERSALYAEALALLTEAASSVLADRSRPAPLAAGTAGTIRDLGRLGLALSSGIALERVRGLVVTRDQLETAVSRLVTVSAEERGHLPGVSGSRIDILPAGGIVLLAALEAFGVEQLQLCDWGLREGALLDALSDERVITLGGDFHDL